MKMREEKVTLFEKQQRIPAIDRFRGLAMSLLIMFGAAIMYVSTDFFKPLTTHNLDIAFQILPGYALYDFGAPLFLFASGLSFSYAFSSAERKYGISGAYRMMAKHALKIIGLGSLFWFDLSDTIGIIGFSLWLLFIVIVLTIVLTRKRYKKLTRTLVKASDYILTYAGIAVIIIALVENILFLCSIQVSSKHWSALPSIGCAILIALCFVRFKPEEKVFWVTLLTALYYSASMFIPGINFEFFAHGGLLGSIGYALSFLYADLVGTLNKIPTKKIPLSIFFAVMMEFLSLISYTIMLPSKAMVNLTYILISFGFSYVIYVVIQKFDGIEAKRFPVLTIIGQNCLLVFILNFFLTYVYGICFNALIGYIPVGGDYLHVPMFIISMLLFPFIMAGIVKQLRKQGLYLKL